MNFEKIGGIASIVEVFLWIFLMVAISILFPRLGLVNSYDWADPIKNIAAWKASPNTFNFFHADIVLWGLTFVVLVPSLRSRLWDGAPNLMMLSIIGATIAASLWITSGALGIIGKEPIVNANDVSAFMVITVATHSLTNAADFVFGWVLLFIGVAGIKTSKLSQILSWVLIIEGICWILCYAIDPLGLLGFILGIVSNVWLGIILLGSKTNSQAEVTNS